MTDIEQARECVAKAFETDANYADFASAYRSGRFDAKPEITAVLAAIKGERERCAGKLDRQARQCSVDARLADDPMDGARAIGAAMELERAAKAIRSEPTYRLTDGDKA